MIVIGIDPHKQTHTAAAIESTTGELGGELTVPARRRGHAELVAWARSLGGERRFALEDCRHVSVSLGASYSPPASESCACRPS